ncbi:MAG: hypothetical protein AAF533_29095 [Acidobacteriota bacterium]
MQEALDGEQVARGGGDGLTVLHEQHLDESLPGREELQGEDGFDLVGVERRHLGLEHRFGPLADPVGPQLRIGNGFIERDDDALTRLCVQGRRNGEVELHGECARHQREERDDPAGARERPRQQAGPQLGLREFSKGHGVLQGRKTSWPASTPPR